MFAPKFYYAQPQHIDFAALAEARAAEAVAKAAEAEYLAQQAEAHAYVRAHAPLWSSITPAARYSGRFSCPCVDCAGLEQPSFSYMAGYQDNHPPLPGHAFGVYGRPQHAHQHHHELEVQLRKERVARLQLEEEIRQLKAREQNMVRAHRVLRAHPEV